MRTRREPNAAASRPVAKAPDIATARVRRMTLPDGADALAFLSVLEQIARKARLPKVS